jgi:Flp pilus assembly protein TadG
MNPPSASLTAFKASRSGEGLIETALIVPFLLTMILNAVNFGYFFLVALNLTAAPRSAVEYSIQGFNTPATASLASGPSSGNPSADNSSVAYLIYQDMIGALASSTSATVTVCSNSLGAGKCVTCSGYNTGCNAPASSPGGANYTDPEASFVLNRVDVTYTFRPLIPGTAFNLTLLPTSICSTSGGVTCSFHRYASMREMN